METLIGFFTVVGGMLVFATFYKPQMRKPGTPSQRSRNNNRTTGGSSHG